jgi:hypothetical protein
MEKIKLDYNAINVANAEDRSGKSFFDAFNSLSADDIKISQIVFLLRAGGASDAVINQAVQEAAGNNVAIFECIFDALGESGFLGQKLDQKTITVLKQRMKEAVATENPKGSKTSKASKTTGDI